MQRLQREAWLNLGKKKRHSRFPRVATGVTLRAHSATEVHLLSWVAQVLSQQACQLQAAEGFSQSGAFLFHRGLPL